MMMRAGSQGFTAAALYISLMFLLTPGSGHAQADPLKDLESRAGSDASSADLHYQLGMAYMDQDRLKDAGESFRKVLRLEKGSSRANTGLALIEVKKGKLSAAKSRCRSMMRKNPVEANTCLGDVFNAFGRGSRAEDAFNNAIKKNPSYAPAHAGMGDRHLNGLNYDAAIESYNRALSLDPDLGRALLGRGQAFLRKGDRKNAAKDLKASTVQLPGYASPYFHLAVALGMTAQAEKALLTAVQINPSHAEAFRLLGQVQVALGRGEKGVASLKKAIELQPDIATTHLALGNCLKDLKRIDEARSSFKKAIELMENLPGAHEGLGDIEAGQKEFRTAIDHYKDALRLAPTETMIMVKLGDMYYRLGRYTMATSYLEKALLRKNNISFAHFLLGQMACETRQFDRGRKHYDEALKGDGTDIDAGEIKKLKSACVSKIPESKKK